MKQFLVALALTCAFSVSALAGDVSTCGIEPPPAPNATVETTMSGDISSSHSAGTGGAHTCGLVAVLTILDLVF